MADQPTISLSLRQTLAWQHLEDSTTREVLYGGGAGGGKTFFGCVWHIYRRQTHAKTRGVIARKTLQTLKGTTLVTFLKVANMMGYKLGKHYSFNQNDMLVTWANGSTTLFKEIDFNPSDPDFQRLGGLEVTDAFIDEAAEVTEKAFDILQSRIRWMLAEYNLTPKILMTCNPGDNWIKAKYIKDEKGNPVMLEPYQVFIPALVDDNPDEAFVRIYKENLEKISSDYDKRRLLLGDWDANPDTGGNFYKAFSMLSHTAPISYNPSLPVHISFDFNVSPHMTLTVWQVIKDGDHRRFCQVDEICLSSPHNSTAATCKEFVRRYAGHDAGVFVYGDPAGNQRDTRSESGMNDYSIINSQLAAFKPVSRVKNVAPSVVGRGQFINAILANEIPDVSILINRECNKTIADYTNLKEASEGGKDKRKVTDPKTGIRYEPYGHCSDANDYLLCRILEDEYTKFAKGGSRRRIISTGISKSSML